MANTLLTPTAVTREALRILHQKLTFVGNINRQYDNRFAQSGAKIGDSLKIRLPNQYSVRTGAVMNVQDVTESSETLQVATVKGVDLNFSSQELTLDIDDFSSRILEPAMAVLAANIESDALSMYKDVYNQVDDVSEAITFKDLMEGRKVLVENLTPMDRNCFAQLHPNDNVNLVDALKGLFHDDTAVTQQYREGLMGRTAGFTFYENSLMPKHTSGSEGAAVDTGADVNGASQTGASVTVDGTVTGTWKDGDIVSFAGCNAVHPETKADLGVRKRFVVTSDVAASYSSIPISPSIVTSGATQNVSASPTDDGIVYKEEFDESTAIGASTAYNISLLHHRDAFAFATADLELPGGVDFAAREVYDGISMLITRQYDINNLAFPCRVDVLYGYKAIRPQLACRLAFGG